MNAFASLDTNTSLALGLPGFTFADLFQPDRLADLTEVFYERLRHASPEIWERFDHYRTTLGEGMSPEEISAILVDTAPYLGDMLCDLFGVNQQQIENRNAVARHLVVTDFKRDLVTRRAAKRYKTLDGVDPAATGAAYDALRTKLFASAFTTMDEELALATVSLRLLDYEKKLKGGTPIEGDDRSALEELVTESARIPELATGAPTSDNGAGIVAALLGVIEQFVAIQSRTPGEGRSSWTSLQIPGSVDFMALVDTRAVEEMAVEAFCGPAEHLRLRDGFQLTDRRYGDRKVMTEVEYCIFCHERSRDSCSKGFFDKDGSMKKNPLGIPLTGCPLDEKISEMHYLKHCGDGLAGLAVLMIDNPLCPGTGHRICNDCMKGCIYQKQDPVNIPQIETNLLTEVLDYPWGFEIYSLLTRWNPLNVRRPHPLPYNGLKILVVGLGPAGYTLAHYLINEGFGVVGIDGLKIEPLPEHLTGTATEPPAPICDWRHDLYDELDDRILLGFGGVSEYGITVRWDKNFLKVIYIALARRQTFRFYGGVRFGGTITIDDAWAMGFEHIAIATGAGRPTIVPMKQNLLRGIRQASDFLMALQLTGAYKPRALANLQVRLPAIVIGGGLTGIDTATELMAYYPVQVERFLDRTESLIASIGEEAYMGRFSPEEREIVAEFMSHGRQIRAERERAAAEGRKADLLSLVRSWGGVSLVYRKSMIDAPAYRLNHEEIIKALEEGIYFIERQSPVEAVADEYGAVRAMIFEGQHLNDEGKWRSTGVMTEMPARSVMIAAGTSPNTMIGRENPGAFELDRWGQFFAPYADQVDAVGDVLLRATENNEVGFFTSYNGGQGRMISYYGDNHPHYAGNVVKAMASARDGYPHVVGLFTRKLSELEAHRQQERDEEWTSFGAWLDDRLTATVHEVIRLTPTIVEVVVRAPLAAERFRPGQFYRLQNFETTATRIDDTPLLMEGLALTGAWVDVEKGLMSTIVLEMGTSSRLCALLKPGEKVVLMGPTGAPTEIPKNEDVILCGGGLGNAVLFSIGKAMRANGCRVVYFAGYKVGEDVYYVDNVEDSADQVIWSSDAGAEITPRRPQDRYIRGNILQAMTAWGTGVLGDQIFPMQNARRLVAIGSDRMMNAIREARHGTLKELLGEHVGIGSINSPMQCMMKEVCAQCLQRHVDPETGTEKGFIFSCFNQDQKLDEVDFDFLNSRLRANSVLEKISNMWLDHLLP